jgi:hypothetical protein
MGKRFTKRDKEIISYIERHKVVNSSQLKRKFNLSDVTLCRRMKFITENSEVKKYRYIPQINFYDSKYKEMIPNENIYYWKRKPKNIVHSLLVNETILFLQEKFDIVEYELEYPIIYEDVVVRADICFSFKHNEKEWTYLVEVEVSKSFNYSKYLKLQQGNILLPKIIVLSDRKVYNKTNYEIIKGRLNLSNLENKIKQDMIECEFNYKVK